ncbi:hypothetical protein [Thiohalocapsa marina]
MTEKRSFSGFSALFSAVWEKRGVAVRLSASPVPRGGWIMRT